MYEEVTFIIYQILYALAKIYNHCIILIINTQLLSPPNEKNKNVYSPNKIKCTRAHSLRDVGVQLRTLVFITLIHH